MTNIKNTFDKAQVGIKNVLRYLQKKSAIINLNLVATNLCNQHCPMCNTTLMRDQKNVFSVEIFKDYMDKLKSYPFASCTISGGEPTLIKELPEILEIAPNYFPFGILLISNLYGNTKHVMRCMESALKNNVNLSISFDGFDDVADKLRGASNVTQTMLKHMHMIKDLHAQLNSKSTITLHTVMADLNIAQVPKMFELSKEFGWKHSIAPVNTFYYQDGDSFVSKLSYTQQLMDVCELALKEDHVDMMESYVKGIALYTLGKSPKLCPYLTDHFRSYKIFLEPDGSISLCDRMAIGNLNEMTLDDMVKTEEYDKSLHGFEDCEGCWMGCFVEPHLRMSRKTGKQIVSDYAYNISHVAPIQMPPILTKEDMLPTMDGFSNNPQKEPVYQIIDKE